MTDAFTYLLEDLGKIFRMPLHVDKVGACSILFPQNFLVQIQVDSSGENLFLFAKLGTLPPGKFREEVFKEALLANGDADPVAGILGYREITTELVLFQSYLLTILNGDRLAGLFGSFLEMGLSWKNALAKGQTHPPKKDYGSQTIPFGLKL